MILLKFNQISIAKLDLSSYQNGKSYFAKVAKHLNIFEIAVVKTKLRRNKRSLFPRTKTAKGIYRTMGMVPECPNLLWRGPSLSMFGALGGALFCG
ncbi:MAG: hypothetical protein MI921_18875 [Cytophagales bacterium]|nr:hypothetical protein [Cytophagales bacterium]